MSILTKNMNIMILLKTTHAAVRDVLVDIARISEA